MKTLKYLSLFSGVGGFEYGLEQSKYDFECIGFSEIDKYSKSIYIRRFPKHKDLGDATEIRTEELEDFELLVGGFPCQAFSMSGKRKGFDDTRGTLFFEIARICAEKKPRYILVENVKGLLSHDGGRTYNNPKDNIDDKIEELLEYVKPRKLMCYVLIGYWSTPEEDLKRIMHLYEDYNIEPYVMPYDKTDPNQRMMVRWCNNKKIFKTRSWQSYLDGNRSYGSGKKKK